MSFEMEDGTYLSSGRPRTNFNLGLGRGIGEKTLFIFFFSDEEVVCSAARGLIFAKDRVEAVGGIVGEAMDTATKRGNAEESN